MGDLKHVLTHRQRDLELAGLLGPGLSRLLIRDACEDQIGVADRGAGYGTHAGGGEELVDIFCRQPAAFW